MRDFIDTNVCDGYFEANIFEFVFISKFNDFDLLTKYSFLQQTIRSWVKKVSAKFMIVFFGCFHCVFKSRIYGHKLYYKTKGIMDFLSLG